MTALIAPHTMQTICARAQNLPAEYKAAGELMDRVWTLEARDGHARHAVCLRDGRCDCRGYAVRGVCAHSLGAARVLQQTALDMETEADALAAPFVAHLDRHARRFLELSRNPLAVGLSGEAAEVVVRAWGLRAEAGRLWEAAWSVQGGAA